MHRTPFLIAVALVCPVADTARAQPSWYSNYKQLADIEAKLDAFVSLRPDLVSPLILGNSYEGRAIRGVRIAGTADSPNRPAVLLDATQHAREWVAPMVNMYVAEQLISNYDTDPAIRDLVDNVEFFVVPVVNPDGYVYSWEEDRYWRKNRRPVGGGEFGVDLNRNWAYGWGLDSGSSGDPGSNIYRGPSPFSESETQALRDFYYANQQIVANIDFHSYSQLILYPWGYTDQEFPPDNEMLHALAEQMAASIYDVHNETYIPQPAHDLYLASGVSIDWTYGDQGVYSYTIELRPTDFPYFELPPGEILPNAQEIFPAVLDLATFAWTLTQGDFNNDGAYDCTDADALVEAIVMGTNKYEFDLTGSGSVDLEDLDAWLAAAGAANLPSGHPYLQADANLNGAVDGEDFTIWNAHKFTSDPSFCSGDFNANGVIEGGDFVIWNQFKFMTSEGLNVVPEPAAAWFAVFAIPLLLRRRVPQP
jgi:carboxypeptidase T